MPKILFRIMALSLIPCLIGDPATMRACALTDLPNSTSFKHCSSIQDPFIQEAFIQRILNFYQTYAPTQHIQLIKSHPSYASTFFYVGASATALHMANIFVEAGYMMGGLGWLLAAIMSLWTAVHHLPSKRFVTPEGISLMVSADDYQDSGGITTSDDPYTLAALDDLLDRLRSNNDPQDQINALKAIETILERVHAPEALVFDFGGVVVSGSHRLGVRHFVVDVLGLALQESELDQLHERIFKGTPIAGVNYAAAKLGFASEEQYMGNALSVFQEVLGENFTRAFAHRFGAVTTDNFISHFRSAYYEIFNRMEENESAILQLMMQGMPVFVLSNNYRQKYEYIQRERVPFLHHIGAFLSDEAGASKPDPKIFDSFVRKLEAQRSGQKVDPSRIIFFDDKIENCRAAYSHGHFYASQYDSNRGDKLSDNAVIHEILSKSRLLEVIFLLEQIGVQRERYEAVVVTAAGAALQQLRPLAQGLDIRTRLLALRVRLHTNDQRLMDEVGLERLRDLSAAYSHELEAIYQAEERLRGLEFEMVYAHAGFGMPMQSLEESDEEFRARQQREADRISSEILAGGVKTTVYDKARRDIDDVLDPNADPNPYQMALELSRVGVDAYFAIPYCQALGRWKESKKTLQDALRKGTGIPSPGDLAELLIKVSAVIERRPALKDFRKPLIVIIAGGNGVGKSTLASPIAWFLHIKPKSSDDTRASLRDLIGKDLVPALHASSFEAPLDPTFLRKYFEQAIVTLGSLTGKGGIFAEWQRQIDSGESSLWEGVAFIPGCIPYYFYEIANIVHMVVDMAGETVEQRKQAHIERFTKGRSQDTRAAVRKADRYLNYIGQIRSVQEILLSLAKIYSLTIIQNDNPQAAVTRAVRSLITPFVSCPSAIPSAFATEAQKTINLRARIKNDSRFGRAVHFMRDKAGHAFVIVNLHELKHSLDAAARNELNSWLLDLGEPVVWNYAQPQRTALPEVA